MAAFLEDPRLRQRWNQISHNAETVTENAAAGIWTFQHTYITPCFESLGQALDSCTAVCLGGDREERARRQRERERGAHRTLAENSFDFYDDWYDEYGEDLAGNDDGSRSASGSGGGGAGGLFGTGFFGSWRGSRAEDWDRLVVGTGSAGRRGVGRDGTDDGGGGSSAMTGADGSSGSREVTDQPRRKRGMSYNQRALRRKQPEGDDPTIIPSTAPLGFLGRLPFKIGGTLRYRPSAANLREHPTGGGNTDHTRILHGEHEPLLGHGGTDHDDDADSDGSWPQGGQYGGTATMTMAPVSSIATSVAATSAGGSGGAGGDAHMFVPGHGASPLTGAVATVAVTTATATGAATPTPTAMNALSAAEAEIEALALPAMQTGGGGVDGARKRSSTTSSGGTSDSYRSRGDLFPSDEEDDEDAVPLDDEFAAALGRAGDDRSSARTRFSSSSSLAGGGGGGSGSSTYLPRKGKRRADTALSGMSGISAMSGMSARGVLSRSVSRTTINSLSAQTPPPASPRSPASSVKKRLSSMSLPLGTAAEAEETGEMGDVEGANKTGTTEAAAEEAAPAAASTPTADELHEEEHALARAEDEAIARRRVAASRLALERGLVAEVPEAFKAAGGEAVVDETAVGKPATHESPGDGPMPSASLSSPSSPSSPSPSSPPPATFVPARLPRFD